MNIAVLSQGRLSRIVPVAPLCQHGLAKDVRCQLKHVNSKTVFEQKEEKNGNCEL